MSENTRHSTSYVDAQRLAAMLLAPENVGKRPLPFSLVYGPWIGLVLALVIRYI